MRGNIGSIVEMSVEGGGAGEMGTSFDVMHFPVRVFTKIVIEKMGAAGCRA